MASHSRFLYVCDTCKWRKKACDKKLPSCTYCVQRAIACHYPESAPGAQATRNPTPVGVNAAFKTNGTGGSSNPEAVKSLTASARADLLLVHSVSDHAYLLPFSGFPTNAESFDGVVHKRVSRLLQAAGLSVESVLRGQPEGICYSLPTIPKDQFTSYQHAISSFTPPTADVSILILAAALLAFGRDISTRTTDLVDQESLYLSIKTIYAQVQALVPVSMPLIQTGIVVATYEYLSGRYQVAMVTLAACTTMFRAHEIAIGMNADSVSMSSSYMSSEAIGWCIITLERLAGSEIQWRSGSFALSLPDKNARLNYHPSMTDWNKHCDPSIHDSPRIQDLSTPGRGLLGAVQACWLLDRILRLIESPQPLRSNLPEVYALADDLRTLLNAVLEIEANESGCCGAIGAVMQAEFLFRTHIVKSVRDDPELEKLYIGSQMALQTVTRMAVDLAQSKANGYDLTPIDLAAPACRATTRSALRYLDEYEQQQPTLFNSNSREVLQGLTSSVETRWQAVDPYPNP